MSNFNEKVVRVFLLENPGYLKCSATIIAKYSGVDDIPLVKKIRGEVNAEKFNIKARIKDTSRIINPTPKSLLGQEMLDNFQKIAKQLGYSKSSESDSKTVYSDENIFSPPAKKVFTVKTPSIPEQVGMHIMLGCNHVPFQNDKMHRGIIQLLNDYKSELKGFHLMGDFLDMNALSSHDKGKFTAVRGLTLDDEYRVGNTILDEYEAVLRKDVWKTYMWGNHEDRYNRWMKVFDNSKTPLVSPTDALNLWHRGYQVKDRWSQDFFTIGKDLDIFHGIYWNIHCAKAHLDKLRRSSMFVHTHRAQMYAEGNMSSYNIGAGADFSSPAFSYATRAMKSAWNNGFAITMIDEQGKFHVTQIICQNGGFYFGGKAYGF